MQQACDYHLQTSSRMSFNAGPLP